MTCQNGDVAATWSPTWQMTVLPIVILASQGPFHLGDATVVYQLHSPHRGVTRTVEEGILGASIGQIPRKTVVSLSGMMMKLVNGKEVLNQLKPKKKSLKSEGIGSTEASVLDLVRLMIGLFVIFMIMVLVLLCLLLKG
ncbi:hypothetical protein LXL04_019683 [Taraxacum kok-saghyz]